MKRARRAAVRSLALVVMAGGGGDEGGAEELGVEVFEGVGQASGDLGRRRGAHRAIAARVLAVADRRA